jgi:hypothetical protein
VACIAVVSFVPADVDVVTDPAVAPDVKVMATHILAAADVMAAAVLPPTQELAHQDGDGGVAQAQEEEEQIDVEEPERSHGAMTSPARRRRAEQKL